METVPFEATQVAALMTSTPSPQNPRGVPEPTELPENNEVEPKESHLTPTAAEAAQEQALEDGLPEPKSTQPASCERDIGSPGSLADILAHNVPWEGLYFLPMCTIYVANLRNALSHWEGLQSARLCNEISQVSYYATSFILSLVFGP